MSQTKSAGEVRPTAADHAVDCSAMNNNQLGRFEGEFMSDRSVRDAIGWSFDACSSAPLEKIASSLGVTRPTKLKVAVAIAKLHRVPLRPFAFVAGFAGLLVSGAAPPSR